MAEDYENSPNPPPVPPTPQAPHTISTIKLLFLKKGEYDIWAMKMKHYLAHTYYPIWEVIQKGNGPIQVSTYTNGQIRVLPPKTAEEILAREKMSPLKMPIRSFLGLYLLPGPNGPQLDHEDIEQVDEFDLEEIDLKWQVAMIFTRLKKFYKKTGRKLERRLKGNQKSRRRDVRNTGYKARDNERRPAKQDEHKAMVTIDGECVDWTGHAEDDTKNYALMAFNSSNSGSDTKVTSCLKVCEESYAKLKRLYNEQREKLGVASIEIQAYTLALKKVEAQLVCHQKDQLAYEEKISQMSAKDKYGLGYVTQIHKGVLSYENEVLESVFDNRSSDVEDSHVNDIFVKVDGMHAVPPSMTGIYMPPKSKFRIDKSKFTYAPKQSKTSESDAKTSDLASGESNSSVETLESVPKPVESKPKAVSEPKVWSDALIIEEYELDSDDEYVFQAPDNPHQSLKGKGIIDSGCSRHMTGNKAYLVEYQDFFGGPVAFGGSKGQITSKDTECLVLSHDFKLPDENQVLLRVHRQNNMYSFNLENIVPLGGLACLITKATVMNLTNGTGVSTAYYVLNRVLVTKPQNKTPYELINGKIPIISYIRPFGCHMAILNTIDHLGNFEEKSDEGFLVGYSLNSKAFRPVTAENKANKTEGPKEANNSAEPKNGDEKLIRDTVETLRKTFAKSTEDLLLQAGAARANSANNVNTASTPVNTVSLSRNVSDVGPSYINLSTSDNQDDSQIPSLEDIYEVPNDGIFTGASYDDEGAVANFTNLESTVNIKPKKISQALKNKIWVNAMQEELLQFKTQQVWILVDSPFGKKVIGTKWVYMNKKDERGVVVRNKARLVAQRYRKEEGIDYDEVFAPVARIEAIRIFLAFASYMGFIVYQMDVKSAFLYGEIDKEVRGLIDKTLFIKKDKNDIMLDKYVAEILKKIDFMSMKTTSTPIETKKPLFKDVKVADVDVHLYRSMIGSLMYMTTSRPDIMYAVCACSRFQVTSKTLHLHVVKMIFRCLKGQPKLGLWYPKESAFDLEAYSDSDYAGANLDRKSTT
nr:ribonuclease H-like domain-containing protein [Tanacetum cinerariifolium]